MTAPAPAAAGLPAEDVERVADLLALHDDYRVNEDGWTVCLCGHVAEGDDDDGSHARHLASVLAAALAEMRPSPDSEADADEAMHRIADRYRDKDTARFAIGDYRDWLRERRPTAAEEAVRRLIAVAPVMWHGDYPVKAVPVSDLLSALAAPVSHDADGGERR